MIQRLFLTAGILFPFFFCSAQNDSAATKLYNYRDKVFAVFNKCRAQDEEITKVITAKKVNDIEQGRIALLQCATDGIKQLDSIESFDGMLSIAKKVKALGANILRGGAFKPRTSPYDFQGLGEEGLKILQAVGKEVGICTISEVMDTRQVDLLAKYVDILQIGARNMQNFSLLKEVGIIKKPVMLKRGMSATIKEWLMSGEYLLANGNFDVMLCERGIRTFETATRNTLDINAVPVAKRLSHLPVVVDPSHGTGSWEYVAAGARAGIAAGGDALMIEVHENPEEALSDGAQSLMPDKFQELMVSCKRVAQAVDREF